MPAVLAALAFLAASVATAQVTRDVPSYSAATIVNAASNDANALAPYTIIKINGTNLASDSKSMQPTDIRNSMVPTVLPNTGVRVFVRGQPAGILSVSPTLITALIPGDLTPGPAVVQLMLDSMAGPPVTVDLIALAPGVFAKDDSSLIVARENGDLVTPDAPLKPGEKMVLHATGLGTADPPLLGLEIPSDPVPLDAGTMLVVYLNDTPIERGLLSKVSVVPGQAGIYQLTVQLPLATAANPELRVEANGVKSPAGFKVPVRVDDP